MIENGAVSTYQQPPFIYGQILQRSLYLAEPEQSQLPGIGRFVSQGAAAGAIVYFLFLVVFGLRINTYYWYLVPRELPKQLAWGICIGAFKGLLVWAGTRLMGHRLGTIPRGIIGALGFTMIQVALYFYYQSDPGETGTIDWTIVPWTVIPGAMMGLIIGSNLDPWRALVRSRESGGADVLARCSGFLLRLAVLFLLMEFTLFFILVLRLHSRRPEVVFVAIGLCHFVVSSILVFIKLNFVPLSILAFIANTPVTAWFFELRDRDWFSHYVIFGYLVAWAVFLLSRSCLVHRALSVFKEEIRYYLID